MSGRRRRRRTCWSTSFAGGLDAVLVYESNISQVREHVAIVRLDLPGATAIQPFAIGGNSQHKQLARRLLDALASAESQEKYKKAGFRWLYQSKKP